MVKSMGVDFFAAAKFVSNPRGIPGAFFSLIKRVFGNIAFALKQGRWGELATRTALVLTPVVGSYIGMVGFFTALLLGTTGCYVADKFFIEERRFSGEATLSNREFIDFTLEEYHMGTGVKGFDRLSSIIVERMEQLSGEVEETKAILACYPQLKQIASE